MLKVNPQNTENYLNPGKKRNFKVFSMQKAVKVTNQSQDQTNTHNVLIMKPLDIEQAGAWIFPTVAIPA